LQNTKTKNRKDIKRFIFYINLLRAYLSNSIKSRLAYREDFLSGFVAGLMQQLIGVLFIVSLFVRVPSLRGWRREEIFFIFGFSQVALGVFFTFFSNLLELSERYIIEGNFDRVLLRPMNSFFQVITERIYWEEISTLLVGCSMMTYALSKMHLQLGAFDYLVTGALVLSSCAIYLAIFTILVSLTFWFNDRGSVVSVMLMLEGFSRYPVTIFNRVVRIILTFIIPYAFTAFFPSMYVLGKSRYSLYVWMTPAVAVIFFIIAVLVWRSGARAYESTGS
jgi:ABC-2 type transport system permease protein